VQRFRGVLVFKAHRLVYHATLVLILIKKKKVGSCRAHDQQSSRLDQFVCSRPFSRSCFFLHQDWDFLNCGEANSPGCKGESNIEKRPFGPMRVAGRRENNFEGQPAGVIYHPVYSSIRRLFALLGVHVWRRSVISEEDG